MDSCAAHLIEAMKNKRLAGCYRPYYSLSIYPTQGKKAICCTCFCNTFKRENKVVIEKDILLNWNSRQFQFQRKLLSKRDWGFCRGASCEYYDQEKNFISGPAGEAILEKKINLGYAPAFLQIAPSLECNNQCYFCFNHPAVNKNVPRLSRGIIQEIKDDLIPAADWVVITGGEPFVARESFELIDWIISRYPQKKLSVLTNGAFLDEFGLQKVVRHNIRLRITLFGMREGTYRDVTKSGSFTKVFDNIDWLARNGYKHIILVFLLSGKTYRDLGDFCRFMDKNKNFSGIVKNEMFEGEKLWEFSSRILEKYPDLSRRMRVEFRDESAPKRLIRRAHNYWHSLRYLLQEERY